MPTLDTLGLVLLVVLTAAGWFGAWWIRRELWKVDAEVRRLRSKQAALKRRLKAEKSASAALQEGIDAAQDGLDGLAALDLVKRQRDGYRDIIVSIQGERDNWMNLYYSQATGHDNAQRWMMREAQSLAQQLTQLGVQPKVDPVVQRLRSEYQQEHGQHVEDYKSGKAAESHAETVQHENEQVAELAGSE